MGMFTKNIGLPVKAQSDAVTAESIPPETPTTYEPTPDFSE